MLKSKKNYSRREFIAGTGIFLIGTSLMSNGIAEMTEINKEPIIDIHHHIHDEYRTDEQTLSHQRAMGVTTSILLPSGRPINSASTHWGLANGLQGTNGGNAECYLFACQHKKEFRFGACAVPDMRDAIPELEKYLKLGAVVIGELNLG